MNRLDWKMRLGFFLFLGRTPGFLGFGVLLGFSGILVSFPRLKGVSPAPLERQFTLLMCESKETAVHLVCRSPLISLPFIQSPAWLRVNRKQYQETHSTPHVRVCGATLFSNYCNAEVRKCHLSVPTADMPKPRMCWSPSVAGPRGHFFCSVKQITAV